METVYGTRRIATKEGDGKGRAKRSAEPLPLHAANVAARRGRLALPVAHTKVKAVHARHNGCSITPPTYVGGCMSAAVTDAGRLNPGNEVELARVPA